MHLNPFQIDRLATDGLAHLDTIACAMISVCGGQVHEVWPVLAKQRVLSKICAEASRAQDNRTILGMVGSCFFIHQASADITFHFQRVRFCLGDDASGPAFGALGDLLDHLDKSVSDRHSWEALLPPVRPRGRVTTESS